MRNQINITLGTAGHIDHGKTALIRCLTGCDTDRLKEEKERGMSIELGYAPCTLGSLEVGIVDVPGHENFIRTMVAGASGMDACMLVVAADDGPMPQTREHLDILTLLDVRHGIVVLTKIDRVSAEQVQVAYRDIEGLVRGTFLEAAPVMPVSNISGEGLAALYEALTALVGRISPRPADGVFRMPIERAFSIKGHGTVIAGVPTAGAAHVDDEILLLPDGLTGRIKSIQVYGQDSDTVMAGQCAAINIRHWDHRQIERGKTLTVPGFWEPHACCVAQVRLLPEERLFLKHNATVRFHTGTSDRLARAYLLADRELRGGETAFVQLRCDEPIVAGPGDRFIIREMSPPRTIGGGAILETLPHRRKRTDPGILERLSELGRSLADDRALIAFHVGEFGSSVFTCQAIAFCAKVTLARTREILGEMVANGSLVSGSDGSYAAAQTIVRFADELLSRLAACHRESPASPGLLLDELRQSWDAPVAAVQMVVDRLRSAGRVCMHDGRIALPDHRASIDAADTDVVARVESLFNSRAYDPPDASEVAALFSLDVADAARLIRKLLEQHRLVRIDRDLLFHCQAVQRAREMIVAHIREKGRLESVEFKYMLATTRKYAIPLLDYFDRIGLTRRAGDNTRHLRSPEAT